MWQKVACGKETAKMWHSIVGILGVNLTRYALADVENLTSGNEIDFNTNIIIINITAIDTLFTLLKS